MRRNIKTSFFLLCTFILPLIINGCLIEEVDQQKEVKTGDTFTATLTISDQTADSNPHEGVICVLVPDDWAYTSGTYNFSGGTGDMLTDTSSEYVYGDVDTVIPPPANMKWLRLVSDAAYSNPANVVYEVTLNMQVGTKTGDFPIGYLTTKNTADMLGAINPEDTDNDQAWTDTSMNHMVTISAATAAGSEVSNLPKNYNLSQNYPNPFNPETEINYSLKERSFVSLSIYNLSGQLVKNLINEVKNAGFYSASFSALNLPSGVYLYKLTTNNYSAVKKMILLK